MLPQFITGSMILMPGRTAHRLLAETVHHAPLRLDDVYFAGIVRKALKIPLIDVPNIDKQPVRFYECLAETRKCCALSEGKDMFRLAGVSVRICRLPRS